MLKYRADVLRPILFKGAVLMAEYLHYYILFQNHTDATAMYRSLKGKKMYAQISPTPRELSVCCGVSLLVHGEDVDRIKERTRNLLTWKNFNGQGGSY